MLCWQIQKRRAYSAWLDGCRDVQASRRRFHLDALHRDRLLCAVFEGMCANLRSAQARHAGLNAIATRVCAYQKRAFLGLWVHRMRVQRHYTLVRQAHSLDVQRRCFRGWGTMARTRVFVYASVEAAVNLMSRRDSRRRSGHTCSVSIMPCNLVLHAQRWLACCVSSFSESKSRHHACFTFNMCAP
jgi:hypothetical protein